MDDAALIEIFESKFEGNGRIGDDDSPYGTISAADNTFIALNFDSIFVKYMYACFVLYQGRLIYRNLCLMVMKEWKVLFI